ncbi:MAG: hypothetical protein WD715_09185 [Dongiaceae bacterium]
MDDGAQLCRGLPDFTLLALPLGQVANDADEDRFAGFRRLADGEIHRKDASVLAAAFDRAADADDLRVAGAVIVFKIGVMFVAIGRGHQNFDILPDYFVCAVAEQAFAGGIEHENLAGAIDQYDAVDCRLDDGLKQGRIVPAWH